ncbi:DDE-type integrase/transposase/recombinase [Candidatus Nomurabacteria bacterium]|nr:DDE-type integrase/transposase/recombinase [Candidatus Nomurabacteria bacterium]
MPYTTNKNMPAIRREAAQLVYRGWTTRKVARHFGFSQSVIVKWVAKSKKIGYHPIPTKSSRPHHHPKQLTEEVIKRIVELRIKTKRTSEVVHQHLLNEGIKVSLNSVRRTIDRHGLMKKRSKWKRYHPPVDRPYPLKAGDLVQIDTIHRMIDQKKRLYVFVLIDVFSRWVYAKAYEKMNGKQTIRFVNEAQRHAVFKFNMLQSDHGPEFSQWFTSRIEKSHRYTRIGKPNDNAHIERVNRTIQEECLDKLPNNVFKINCALKKYLQYYNYERLHLSLNLKTPMQLIQK